MDSFRDQFIKELIKRQTHVYKPPGFSGLFLKNDDGLVYAYFTQMIATEASIPDTFLTALSSVHELFQNIDEGYKNPCGLKTFRTQDPAILPQRAQKSKRKATESPIATKKGVLASNTSNNFLDSNVDEIIGPVDVVSDEIMVNCFSISNPLYLIALIRISVCKSLRSPLYELPLLTPNCLAVLRSIIRESVGPLTNLDSIKKYALRKESFLIHKDELTLSPRIHKKPQAILIGSYILPKSRPVLTLDTWLWAAVLCSLNDGSSIPHIKQSFLSDFWKTMLEESNASFSLSNFFSNCLTDFYPLIKGIFSFDDFAMVMIKLFDPVIPFSTDFYNRPLFQSIGKNVANPAELFAVNHPQNWYFKFLPYYQPKMFYCNDKMFIGMCRENNTTICRVSSYEHEQLYWKKEFSEQTNTVAQLVKENIIAAEVYRMIVIYDTCNPFLATCKLVESIIDPMYKELYALSVSHYSDNDKQDSTQDLMVIQNQINKSEVNLLLLTKEVQQLICTKLTKAAIPHVSRLFPINDRAWLYWNKDTFVILGDVSSISNSFTLLSFLNDNTIKLRHIWETETFSTDTRSCIQMAINMLDGDIIIYRELIMKTLSGPACDLINLCTDYMLNNPSCISIMRIIGDLSQLSTHCATEKFDSTLTFLEVLYNIFQIVYYAEESIPSDQQNSLVEFISSKENRVLIIPDGYIIRDTYNQYFFTPFSLIPEAHSEISEFRWALTDDNGAEFVLATKKGYHVRIFVKILYETRPSFFTHNRLNMFSLWAKVYDENYQDHALQVGDISATMEFIIKDPNSVCGYDGKFISHFVSKMCEQKLAYQIKYKETSLYLDDKNNLILLIPDLSSEYALMHISDSLMLFVLNKMDIVFRYFINDNQTSDVSFVMVHSPEIELSKFMWQHYKDSIPSLLKIFSSNSNTEVSVMKHLQHEWKTNTEDKSSVCFLLYNNKLKKLHDTMINFSRQYSNVSSLQKFLSYNSSSWKKNILSPSLIPFLESYIDLTEGGYFSGSEQVLVTKSKSAFGQLFENPKYGQ